MNASGLAAEMESELQAQGFVTNNEHSKTQQMCQALATAIVNHIQANAKAIDPGGTAPSQNAIQ